MIVIEPCGGLCNRLRMIRSSVNLAKKYNQKLLVLWTVSDELKCRWEEMFLDCKEFTIINLSWQASRVCSVIRKIVGSEHCFIESENSLWNHDSEVLEKSFDEGRHSIYIKAWTLFYSKGESIYEWLHPIDELNTQIDRIATMCGGGYWSSYPSIR